MKRLGIELTDRCNLACQHCLREINHDRKNLPTELLLRALFESAKLGVREVAFTGGEPTLHPDFSLLVQHAVAQKLSVTVISNGQNPEPLWDALQYEGVKKSLTVALSIEAADQASFESVRGARSYRRLMKTILGLKARGARTRFSVTIGPWNRHQWAPILNLASQLWIDDVSVATYQPTAHALKATATLDELRLLHAEIERAAESSAIPVILSYEPLTAAADHLCSTLGLQDLNLNHRGQFTFCCQLSSLYRSPNPEAVVVADIGTKGIEGGVVAQTEAVANFLAQKRRAWKNGSLEPGDLNPCNYCLRTFGQVARARIDKAA